MSLPWLATHILPPLVVMPVGAERPVWGPEIVVSGGLFPVAPAGKIAIAFAADSVTHRRPLGSRVIPEGVTSPVLGPATTRLGATFPVAPGANRSSASLLALATHNSPTVSKVSAPIPLSPVSAPDSVAIGATSPLALSEKAFTLLLAALPTQTAACGAANACSEKARVAAAGGWDASSAVTVKLAVPVVVGVPLINPVEERVRPAGKEPALTAKEKLVPLPPLAVNC